MRTGSAVCGSDGQWIIEDPDCRGIFCNYNSYTMYCNCCGLETSSKKYVTGFWKTNQIVTVTHLLAQLMATLIHYTCTVPLPGLVNWSAFLEQVLPTL